MDFTVRVGDYIIYPATFVLIFIVMVVIMLIVFFINRHKEKKMEKMNDDCFRITQWQRKHVGRLCKDYVKDNEMGPFEDSIKKLDDFILNSTYWNPEEMLEIDKELIKNATYIMFFVAQESFELKQFDDAVLMLHAIDIMNGGPDNPDYFEGEYPWIGDEVPELKNSDEMSEEEMRTMHLYASALEDLVSFVDEDLGKIPESVSVPEFCKRLSLTDMNEAREDVYSAIDIHALQDETRDVIAKALFNSVSITWGEVLDGTGQADSIDEYRRYPLRALAAAIDNQMYSEVIDSIDE